MYVGMGVLLFSPFPELPFRKLKLKSDKGAVIATTASVPLSSGTAEAADSKAVPKPPKPRPRASTRGGLNNGKTTQAPPSPSPVARPKVAQAPPQKRRPKGGKPTAASQPKKSGSKDVAHVHKFNIADLKTVEAIASERDGIVLALVVVNNNSQKFDISCAIRRQGKDTCIKPLSKQLDQATSYYKRMGLLAADGKLAMAACGDPAAINRGVEVVVNSKKIPRSGDGFKMAVLVLVKPRVVRDWKRQTSGPGTYDVKFENGRFKVIAA